jgi:hypothetical protein
MDNARLGVAPQMGATSSWTVEAPSTSATSSWTVEALHTQVWKTTGISTKVPVVVGH